MATQFKQPITTDDLEINNLAAALKLLNRLTDDGVDDMREAMLEKLLDNADEHWYGLWTTGFVSTAARLVLDGYFAGYTKAELMTPGGLTKDAVVRFY